MEMPYSVPLLQSYVLLIACFCLLGICLAIEKITITQPLRDPQTLFSNGKSFKLGFFSPGNTSNRYVGVMFNVPVMTVIWVANRDKPLTDSAGTFTVSEDGNLVVLDGKKQILWSSNVSNSSASSATALLLDSGNLVLKDNANGRIIWESFQNPSDSFVPKMRVSIAESTNEKLKLTSWSSPSDPSVGNFSTGLQARPIPQIYIWKKDEPYWRSGPWNGNLYIGIPGMNSLYLNGFDLVDDNKGSAYFTFTYTKESRLVYYFLTSSGTILEKYWIKEKQDWDETWSSVANDCDAYGKCGPYGICNPRDSTICTCLQGFEPKVKEEWDKGNWTAGCTRKTQLQCQRNSPALDGYVQFKGVKVPDFAMWKSASEKDCGKLCLKNCFCMAYAYYTGIGCMHWDDNLIDIQQFSFGGANLYVRVAHAELEHQRQKKLILSAISGVAVLLVLAFLSYSFWKLFAKIQGRKQKVNPSLFEGGELYDMEIMATSILRQSALEDLPLYTYDMLSDATLKFEAENRLGKGGFGEVYKGKLADGQEIAVKRLSKSSIQGIEEFMNEVVVISKLQHRNLVRLLGCCVEDEEKMLVYEYLPKKSLDGYIFDASGRELLDWRRRALIIEGIGRGLLYLHRDSRLKIIHRDLKASNILLDEELNPKISDFGLARVFFCDQDQANTRRVVGTCGYMAPEYVIKGRFSEKSDVYSFGVLLLEIVSGRRNTSFDHLEEDELSLQAYAWNLWNECEMVNLIDPVIYDPSIDLEVLRYVHVGLLCVQDFAKDRPNVSAVLSMLNSEIADLPLPTPPAFARRQGFSSKVASQRSVCSINGLTTTIVEGR